MRNDADFHRDWQVVRAVDEIGPLLRDRDGNYLGPPLGRKLLLQPVFPGGPIDRCVRQGYLYAFKDDLGNHLVRSSEKGREFLLEVREALEEQSRRSPEDGRWWVNDA